MAAEEHLEDIEKFAGLLFSIEEIAIILELKALEIVESQKAQNAYDRGRLKTEAELRVSIIEMAKNGSQPAQTQLLKLIQAQKLNDVH